MFLFFCHINIRIEIVTTEYVFTIKKSDTNIRDKLFKL